MKFVTIAIFVVVTGALSHAQPHQHHHHRRAEKRASAPAAHVVTVPGPTVIVYELNGEQVSADEVQQGIANGSLIWAQHGRLSSVASSVVTSTPAPSPVHAPTSLRAASSSGTVLVSVHAVNTPASSRPALSSPIFQHAVPSAPASNAGSKSSNGSFDASSSGVDSAFPDGQLDCSTFPSNYGAVSVEWLGLGGWIGIQQPGSSEGGFSNIMTVTKSTCAGGNCCSEGSYCSYACPGGYQKSQWPSTQGATGQSVGGIVCRNGKLHLTNPSMSTSLCMTGTSNVAVQVQNKMKKNAAVCRTDYPGTEGETVPLDAQPGTTSNLTCPEGDNYYQWQGLKTSAQYYVNPAGVAVQQACQWGSPEKPYGNYAPLNLGVGYSAGNAWLSIFQNQPTTNAKLDFTVELVGDNGGYDNLVGRCKYENGKYCNGDNYENCSPTGNGCTVAVSHGTATFVFT